MPEVSAAARDIFLSALSCATPVERAEFISAACANNADLRHHVEALLRAHDEPDDFLDQSRIWLAEPSDFVAGPLGDPRAEQIGTLIGNYKLLEQIGEGGMGLVYLAEQQSPVRPLVAVKIIKPGMDSRQVIARFEAERQALAMMDHANIAKVLDAGTTDSGRPYFVMELVRGIPINEFCDQERLTIQKRLELFIQVCYAVQHAHQKGIIHRDLKPGNILVTMHDRLPVVKVIDFGVAKALGQQLTDRTLHTGLTQLVGTPLYMSPEQADLKGLDVETRSDVYSLGVLLYELLTGTTPLDQELLKSVGFDEMRRMIREQEPPRPSNRLTMLKPEVILTNSQRRSTDPRRITAIVRGELDWIVMKALEKDRNRRYESAYAFATDVRRYLHDEPVGAYPPTVGYQLQKFARHHWRVLLTTGTLMVVLVIATTVSIWQANDARKARRQAEGDRDQARRAQINAEAAERRATTEAATAIGVMTFLQNDLFGQAHSAPKGNQKGQGLTVREALDRAATKIDERFHDQPLVEAAIRNSIGDAYARLHEDKELAVPHLRRAYELRKRYLGSDHADTLKSMLSLADACVWGGCADEAIPLHQELLTILKSQLGPDHPETVQQTYLLAIAARRVGRWEISLPLLEQIVNDRRTNLGPTHRETLEAAHQLALNYEHAGRFTEAIAIEEKILEINQSASNVDLYVMESAARASQRAGNLDRADQLLRESLVRLRKRQDPVGQLEALTRLDLLSINLLLQGKYSECESIAHEAIKINENYQPDSWRRFHLMSVLGGALLGQQKYDAAESLLIQGYEGLKQRDKMVLPGYRYRITDALERLVHFYESTGQPEKAVPYRNLLNDPKNQSPTTAPSGGD